jgi:hypothetical protein
LATIQLSELCWADSLKLQGREGKFEATKAKAVEVSAFVASHYYGGKNVVVVFSESDRKELESLPERELNMLSDALECKPADVVATLLPKKTRPTKKKASPKKKETSE